MAKKKVLAIILSVIILAAIIFIVIRGNSFKMALKNEGLGVGTVHTTIEHAFDANGQEFKVIQTTTEKEEMAVAIVTKNKWGFWEVTSCDVESADLGYARVGWIQNAGMFQFEWHMVYCGNNAIKTIEFSEEHIPSNVTVNIQQTEEYYQIHVISFAEPEVLSELDVMSILKENKFIERK